MDATQRATLSAIQTLMLDQIQSWLSRKSGNFEQVHRLAETLALLTALAQAEEKNARILADLDAATPTLKPTDIVVATPSIRSPRG